MRSDSLGIAGWIKSSFIDYPGTVSTVLFLSGCNLRCPYCHNPHVVRATDSDRFDHGEILEFLQKRRGLIEGIVLSGGEPTTHVGLAEAAATYRDMGYRIKLDTNGMLPDAILGVKPDYLALDVKTVPRRYADLVGAPFGDIEGRLSRSIDIVRAMGDNAEVRVTMAPGFLDREVVHELGEAIAGVRKVFLQRMQQRVPLLDPSFQTIGPMSEEEMLFCRDVLAVYASSCSIRGD